MQIAANHGARARTLEAIHQRAKKTNVQVQPLVILVT